MTLRHCFLIAFAMLATAMTAFPSWADETSASSNQVTDAKAAELQRQIDVLGQEVQKLKIGEAAAAPTADQETWGFGPAASKVYRAQQGVTLGGYGEILFQSYQGGFHGPGSNVTPGFDTPSQLDRSNIDLARAVLYAGYKFDDHWILNSEFEWEHSGYMGGGTQQDGSSAEVEFLTLDYLWRKDVNFRGGKLLMPMGLTNETHEPTTYLSTLRPLLETLIIPTTWTEYGVGVFGDVGPITYRTYAVTGLNASGFTNQGIGGGKYEVGFANATRWAWVARADYTAVPGLLAGGSFFLGEASTNYSADNQLSVPTKIFEVHAQYNWHAFDLRAMGAYTLLSTNDVAQLNSELSFVGAQSVGSRQGGYYLQAGYDVLNGHNVSLMPFVRWETLDTQLDVPGGYSSTSANLIRLAVAGINFKPIPQLVFKADYEWYLIGDHSGVDQVNAGIGYVF
ncbi:MAG: hypothetical protein P4M08_00075 [Oligoflexia bacterium]|nr:hypothetical protein [Oligoflexia bacterium]